MSRIVAPGSTRGGGLATLVSEAVKSIGLYGRCVEPRIDAVSVRALYPGGPTEAQAESLRMLMAPGEFAKVRVRRGGRS